MIGGPRSRPLHSTRRRAVGSANSPNIFRASGMIPAHSPEERKRIFRLLVEDATLLKGHTMITAQVRLSGGATRSLEMPRPQSMADIRKFKPEIVAEVNRLLGHHRDQEIADILNCRGLKTGEGKRFQRTTISSLRESYDLPSHHERLRMRGMLTTRELADHFQVTDSTIRYWGRQGLIKNCYPDSRISAPLGTPRRLHDRTGETWPRQSDPPCPSYHQPTE